VKKSEVNGTLKSTAWRRGFHATMGKNKNKLKLTLIKANYSKRGNYEIEIKLNYDPVLKETITWLELIDKYKTIGLRIIK